MSLMAARANGEYSTDLRKCQAEFRKSCTVAPAQAGAHNHECVVPPRLKPPARSDNRDRGYGSRPAAFVKLRRPSEFVARRSLGADGRRDDSGGWRALLRKR